MNHFREVIVSGTLKQFLGLVEFERRRRGGANPDYEDSPSEIQTPAELYGPIAQSSNHEKTSLYWLVVNGYYSWFLDTYESYFAGDDRVVFLVK
jgi:hypothetical protein